MPGILPDQGVGVGRVLVRSFCIAVERIIYIAVVWLLLGGRSVVDVFPDMIQRSVQNVGRGSNSR